MAWAHFGIKGNGQVWKIGIVNAYERSRAVYDLRGVPPTLKSVLLCLAYHADGDSWECFPSARLMGAEVGLGKTAVWEAIGTLTEKNYVTDMTRRRSKHGGGRSNRYRVNFDLFATQSVLEAHSSPRGHSQFATRPLTVRHAATNEELTVKRTDQEARQGAKPRYDSGRRLSAVDRVRAANHRREFAND